MEEHRIGLEPRRGLRHIGDGAVRAVHDDAIVAESNACNDASECVYVSPGCPLQCSVAVNSAKKEYVEKEARAHRRLRRLGAYLPGGMCRARPARVHRGPLSGGRLALTA